MSRVMASIFTLSALLAILASPGFAFRMQGILKENGSPVAGSVRMLKYSFANPGSTQVFSNAQTLDAAGRFDLVWSVSISTNPANPDAIALVYFAPGENPVSGAAVTTYMRIFERNPLFGTVQVSPGIADLPFLTSFSGNWNEDWCGLNLAKRPGTTGFEYDGTVGWCNTEYEKLNSAVSRAYPSGNLISNSSFEENYDYHIYPHWDIDGLQTGDYEGVNYPMGNLKPRSGRKAAAIRYTSSSSGPDEQAYLRSSHFRVKPNTEYVLVFYYSAKDPVGTSGVRPMVKTFSEKNGPEVFDMAYGRHGGSTYALTGETWAQYHHPFKTGPLGVFASVELLRTSSNPTGGTFYFDDILVVEVNVSASPGTSMHQVITSTVFADGMNKPIQTRKQSGTHDIFLQTQYNDLLQAVKTSLPVGGSYGSLRASNGYLPDVFNRANSLYTGADGFPNAGNVAFAETQYEASPIGRNILTSAPGYEWRATGSHTLRKFYSSTADLTPSSTEPPPPSTVFAKYAYELSRGEHDQMSRTFKDKFGRVVRSEARMKAANRWIGTDYEYDPNGFLAKVTSPEGPGNAMVAVTTRHNTLGHALSEHSPDYGENRSLYDAAGRLRFVQSQAQRNMSPPRMDYIKYDHLDRVIETGEFLDAAYFLPDFADDPDFPSPSQDNRSVRTLNFYDRVPEDRKYCPDGIANHDYIIRSDAPEFSSREFKTFDEAYIQAYVDMIGKGSFSGQVRLYQVFDSPAQIVRPPLGAVYTPLQLYTQNQLVGFRIIGILRGDASFNRVVGRPFPFTTAWGPLAGRLVQTVSCNQELGGQAPGSKQVSTVYNYDKYGNINDIFEFNGNIKDVNKQWQRTSQTFDAQNRLLSRKMFAEAAASTPEVAYFYSYNHLGKLDEVSDKNGSVIGKHHYNAIGQLTRLDIGQGSGQVQISYTYHVRGWLKKIQALSPSGTRLFVQDLKYEDGTGAYARFDGLVSEYDYATTTATPDKFTFVYGDLDRLTAAMTTARATGQTANPQWYYTYHDNGAISTATREGQTFTYNYETVANGFSSNTNHLNSVSFTGSNSRATSGRDNFEYDGSGRMGRDVSRQMIIKYAGDDLPYKFDYVKGGNLYSQFMIYDAAGNRRSKLLYMNNTTFVSAIHYTSTGKEIRESASQPLQEIFPLDAFGRVVKNASGQQEYEAYLRNHLGSTAKIHNINLNAESYRTDYEPYGKLRLQTTTTGIPVTSKFTGKEHDEGTDLDYFGARYYDADLGVWISPDPVRQYHSPYTYCGNNPVLCVDRDGRVGSLPLQLASDNGFRAGFQNPNTFTRENLLGAREITGNAGMAALGVGVAIPLTAVVAVPFEAGADVTNIGIDLILLAQAAASLDGKRSHEAAVLFGEDVLSLVAGVPIARVSEKVQGGVKGLGNVGGNWFNSLLEGAKDFFLGKGYEVYDQKHGIGEK